MADVSVRPALPEDAPAIAAIQALTLPAALRAGLGAEPPPAVVARLRADGFAPAWHEAVAHPPSDLHRVLVALADTAVVGFAALAPASGPLLTEDALGAAAAVPDAIPGADGRVDLAAEAEIVALDVHPGRARAGHGSRLLAACVDVLRQQGARRVQTWCVIGDDARARFLASAGFAPLAGFRRSFAVGDGIVSEAAWHAALPS